jgi:3-dehydroquinate dehydratase II
MKVFIINGPNLNLLGCREKKLYGDLSLMEIEKYLSKDFPEFDFVFYQSNIEGEIINKIQNASDESDGLIINPGGYAHTSISIKDALENYKKPKIEVHLSNIASREDYRHIMLTASVCDGYISGFKEKSYSCAVFLLNKILNEKRG